MIDLHVHILPGLDDGARNTEEALDMARRACADGITAAVATPHVITGLYSNDRKAILKAVESFSALTKKNGLPLKIMPGAEYRLEPDLPERLARNELLTLNDGGRYLLVELPSDHIPRYTGRVIYELLLKGVITIIAHPERNAGFIKEPSSLYGLVSRGALSQITAGSLTGRFGSAAATTARLFLEYGCAHFLASDGHSARGRAPVLSEALKEAGPCTGMEAERLVRENPQRMARGDEITCAGPREIPPLRRGLLKRFFSR